jgi:hypothetical protein
MLNLASTATSPNEAEFLDWGLVAALRATSDRRAMETGLARRAHSDPVVGSLIADALSFGGQGRGELHALRVLGEPFVFDAWSKYHQSYLAQRGGQYQPGEGPNYWAWELMDSVVMYEAEEAWQLFLRYLAHENDLECRLMAGIAWLESLNFRHAAELIDRIEAEARTNQRLRVVMRGMYPPRDDADIERRFIVAAQEPRPGDVT